jgi:SAM-dependent methyltransferase
VCILCGAPTAQTVLTGYDRLYRTTEQRFNVAPCSDCGLLQLSPRPTAGELSGFYPRQYWFAGDASWAGRAEEAYRRLLIRDHIRFLKAAYQHAGGDGLLLDVGCGGGLLAGMLRAQNVPAMGLDTSLEASSLAWHRHGVPAMVGDLQQTPLAKNSLAVLSMFHVVEHLPDPLGYLRAAHGLLKPSGRLVVQVPNADSLQFRVFGSRWSGIDIPRHLQNFRKRDLVRALELCGFQVVRTKHFSWRDNPAGLATSMAPGLEPVARKMRRLDRSPRARLFKDAAYLALVLISVPFALFEAALGRGSTIMVEARKRAT